MFTLLSAQHKKYMMRQYRLRLLSVIVLLASATLVISIVLLIPSYITLRVERDRLNVENEIQSKDIKKQNAKDLVHTLDEIKSMSSLVSVESTEIFEALKLVLNAKSPGIAITSANYTRGAPAPSTLSLSGTASFRSDLIEFSRRLDREKLFTSIDLPISNLAKETDVKFTLTVAGNF